MLQVTIIDVEADFTHHCHWQNVKKWSTVKKHFHEICRTQKIIKKL